MGCRSTDECSVHCSGGGISHNLPANAKKYGAHVTPEDILNGVVDVPSDMADFYRELSSLTQKGT